jgi:hypothetical protein
VAALRNPQGDGLVAPCVRILPLLAAAILAAALLPGCLDEEGPDEAAGRPPASDLPAHLAYGLAPLEWDADAGLAWWEHFSTTYVGRNLFSPQNEAAAAHIAETLTDAGFEAQVVDYPICTPLLGDPCAPAQAGPASVNVVVALKRGTTDPDHAIALGAHYDNQATVEGAYDNGSGTAMVVETCRHLAQLALNKSLLCLLFDGEEEGTLGSSAFVASPPAGTPEIEFYFGYDMVGLNWPGYDAWKLYTWVDGDHADDLHPFVNDTVARVLGWPAEGAEVFPFNDRNSDEAVFIGAGIPSLRFAGGRTASTYPQYHKPDDTVAFVEQFAGGRAEYGAGFAATLEESTLLVRMLDQTTLAGIQAWAKGET